MDSSDLDVHRDTGQCGGDVEDADDAVAGALAVDLDMAEERRRAGPVEQRGTERQVGGLLARCNLVEGARVEEPAKCAGRANEDSTKRMDKKSAIARICCEEYVM